jgi:hypothetical protein
MTTEGSMRLSRAVQILVEDNRYHAFRVAGNGSGFISMANEKIYPIERLQIVRALRFAHDGEKEQVALLYLLKADDGHFGFVIDAPGPLDDFICAEAGVGPDVLKE